MAAPTSLSTLVKFATGGASSNPRVYQVQKNPTGLSGTIAGRWYSLWTVSGLPRAGVAPTTVAIPTNATDGSLLQVDASGGLSLYLTSAYFSAAAIIGGFVVYDRLLHIGSLSGTVTTAQTVGGTITRNTGGDGNFIFAEIYGQIGATARTITASYTNQAGTSGRTTQAMAFGGTNDRAPDSAIILPLQSGDTGVQSVQSCTISATTGTAGNFGITIGRKLMTAPGSRALCGLDMMFVNDGPQVIDPGACVSILSAGSSSFQASMIWGQILMGEA